MSERAVQLKIGQLKMGQLRMVQLGLAGFLSVLMGTSWLTALAAAEGNSSAPPGATAYATDLQQRIDAALLARGADYEPRTRHKNADGAALFTNRLIQENSPYLLQHAHNPVDWRPWGDDPFEAARRLGRPVLLSIGYSTCHWCHVMEEESFEDLEIAQFINEHYIAIKVDRERRPDVDSIYMSAVQALVGRGGWPMTVIMTPDRKPFFGGTYFPARDGDRGSHKGFLSILREVEAQYREHPETLIARAAELSQRLQKQSRRFRPSTVPDASALSQAVRGMKRSFDPLHGGFGRAPKFPRPSTVDLLLHYHRRSGDAFALHMATHTLHKMASGGIYDHIGGGFHRYATRQNWLAPHFEKMLYDNSQLASLYLDAYQVLDEPKAASVARDILDYVLREMTSPAGGFYSATDAVSKNPEGHDEEGYFFTWTMKEVSALLETPENRAVVRHYSLRKYGNFEGRNNLWLPRPVEDTAAKLELTPAATQELLDSARAKLYAARALRPPPLRDDKVLVAWNALMISALIRGGAILEEPRYTDAARRAARFILDKMVVDGRLMRVSMDGLTSHPGVLNDHAFMVQALLDLFEFTHDRLWLQQALRLQSLLDQYFWDDKDGGYYIASKEQEGLLIREKPDYDGAVPAGSSIAALNLLRLHELTGDEQYRGRGEQILSLYARPLRNGYNMAKLSTALDFYLDRPKEIVIVRPAGGGGELAPFLRAMNRMYLPNRIVVVATEGADLEAKKALVPLLDGKVARDGKVTAYVCEQGVCELPTTDPQVFAEQIATVHPYGE